LFFLFSLAILIFVEWWWVLNNINDDRGLMTAGDLHSDDFEMISNSMEMFIVKFLIGFRCRGELLKILIFIFLCSIFKVPGVSFFAYFNYLFIDHSFWNVPGVSITQIKRLQISKNRWRCFSNFWERVQILKIPGA
jgi:hypothetical protein